MANIITRKNMVVGANQGPVMGVTPTANGLVLNLANEGVEHISVMTPEEATTFAVNVIRLAQQCEFMRAQSSPALVQRPPIEIVESNGRKG